MPLPYPEVLSLLVQQHRSAHGYKATRSHLGGAFPTGDYANWTKCQALFPHVEAMERHRVTDTDHVQVWAKVLYNGSWYAEARGQYGIAERMSRANLKAREENLGLDRAATLNSIDMLVGVLRYQGKYEQAEEMNRRALAGYILQHPRQITHTRQRVRMIHPQHLLILYATLKLRFLSFFLFPSPSAWALPAVRVFRSRGFCWLKLQL
jgi:hypothetical protein